MAAPIIQGSSDSTSNPESEVGLYRIGPIVMRSGVTRKNLWTLFFVSFFSIAMMNSVGIMQAYLFNEILKIPPNEQGSLTGTLLVVQELVVILLVGLAGALSDRVGRPPVFATGFLLLALGYCLYPLASGDLETVRWELVFFRLFIASGVACINVMLSSVANDYPVDRTRAKTIAAVFIFNGVGIASLPRLVGGLPQVFIERGIDPVWAGRYTYWCLSAICVTLALVLLWGLKPGAMTKSKEREPLLATLKVGLAAARMPRVALGYAAAFVSRADLAVVSQFLTLWLVQEGMAQGMTPAQATVKATFFYIVIQAFALPWAVVFGILLDKIDRLKGLMIGMGVAFVGYASLGLLENPLSNGMYIAAAFVGAGEMSSNISATSLIGKEAPERGRGAVLGLFSLFGAVGIMVVGIVGGWLFDNWKPVGPFLYMAGSNAFMVLAATVVLVADPAGPAATKWGTRRQPGVDIIRNLTEQQGTVPMETTRRELLQNFATVGPLGALSLGMLQAAPAFGAAADSAAPNGFLTSRYGKGPALDGPYLDLRTGKGNKLAYARIQGDLDPAKQKYFWFKGYCSGVRPGKRIDDLCGAEGFGSIRLLPQPDGTIQRLCREVILYTDLRSGEVLQEWKNPYLNETVKVVHVANDPFNYVIEDYFPAPPSFGGLNKQAPPPRVPFILPWTQNAAWLEMEIHIHLAYPSALQPDKWPRESAGPVAQVSEFFAHHVRAEDMQNEKLTTVDYRGTWNRITPWLPWMLMGQMSGQIQYNCFMGNTDNLEQVLHKSVLDYAEKNYKKYLTAPETYVAGRSLSSLEYYAQEQQPQPLKPAPTP